MAIKSSSSEESQKVWQVHPYRSMHRRVSAKTPTTTGIIGNRMPIYTVFIWSCVVRSPQCCCCCVPVREATSKTTCYYAPAQQYEPSTYQISCIHTVRALRPYLCARRYIQPKLLLYFPIAGNNASRRLDAVFWGGKSSEVHSKIY